MRLRSRSVNIALIAVIVLSTLASRGLLVAPAGAKEDPLTRTWARTDWPVANGSVSRTWMWGPAAFTEKMVEPYTESPDGERVVLYWDKSRMEITHPDAFDDGVWYVSNGLLVRELITGRMQVGDNEFENRAPAQVTVAGDLDDPNGPTFATFGPLLGAAPYSDGATITTRVDRSGNLSDDPSLASQGVTAAHLVDVPGIRHQVAAPFWAFMNSEGPVYEEARIFNGPLFVNPFYATGYPITEAYWANVKVGGTQRDVLMQCFERRCLTYTPGNPDGWQVEAGNVGIQYYAWRYGTPPGGPPPDADDNRTLTVGQSLSGTIDPITDQDTYYFDGTAGQRVSIEMIAATIDLDSYLSLYAPDGSLVNDPDSDDDNGWGTDSLIYNVRLPASGQYRIVAESYAATSAGGYTISLLPDDGGPTEGPIVYQSFLDDWDVAENDTVRWFVGDDGFYHILVKPNSQDQIAWNQTVDHGDISDLSASVYIRRVSPASQSIGCLIVRSGLGSGDGAAYRLCLRGDGLQSFADYAGWFGGTYSTTQLLAPEERPASASPDLWNKLEIMTSGNRLWFYINGVLVGSVSHDGPLQGAVGIQVGAEDNSAAEFEFFRLTIRSVSGP